VGTNFTYKIVGKYSTDTNLIGTKFNINNKTHTWSLSDCSKHVKLSRGKNSHCAICTQDSHPIEMLADLLLDIKNRGIVC
jgi:hypothetical protein